MNEATAALKQPGGAIVPSPTLDRGKTRGRIGSISVGRSSFDAVDSDFGNS